VRHRATGRVGLQPSPHGVETPPFDDHERVVGVSGAELVDRRTGAPERRAPITTVRAAADFFGVPAGVPGHLWKPVTEPVDAPFAVDPTAVAALASWFAFVGAALDALRTHADAAGAALDPLTLWPEGFDLATTGAGVNYGGSPGDRFVAEPYLYVGPVDRPFPSSGGPFWNAPFGASLRYGEIGSLEQAVAFLTTGFDLAAGARSVRPSGTDDA
jgi:hypothetical protein